MKYACLIYYDEKQAETMSDAEWAALVDACTGYGESLREAGHYLGGEALEPTATATTVRLRDGKPFVTDGPFAETREQLGGLYLIEADDLNAAIQIAAKIPPARLGCIEVRPLRKFPAAAH